MARSKDQRCISSPGDEIRWLTAGLRTTDPSPVAERHPAASGRQVATRRRYADAVSQTANHGWVAPAKRLAGWLVVMVLGGHEQHSEELALAGGYQHFRFGVLVFVCHLVWSSKGRRFLVDRLGSRCRS